MFQVMQIYILLPMYSNRILWSHSVFHMSSWKTGLTVSKHSRTKYTVLAFDLNCILVSREKLEVICSHLVETNVILPLVPGHIFVSFTPVTSKTTSQRIEEFIRSYDGPNGTPMYELRRKFSKSEFGYI